MNAEIADLEARLARGKLEEMSLLDEVALLDQQLAHARAAATASTLLLESEARGAALARHRSLALAHRLTETKARVAIILEAMYRSSASEGLVGLLESTGDQPAGNVDAPASLFARRQADLAAELEVTARAAREAESEALRRAREAERLVGEAQERSSQLTSTRMERRRRLNALASDRSRAAELEEERALAEAGLLADVAALGARRGNASRQVPKLILPREDLPGLRALQGRLPWPIELRGILRGAFGDVVNPRHGTRTPRHGILLEAPEGSPIRAIAPGRVVFADWFKGFGRCVIVDHGREWMSVQAHARSLFVTAGDDVVAGQVIAEVGDTGSLAGPRLYFELTREGEPVNPLEWLAR